MQEKILTELGLSSREAKAYLSLLKIGEATALELSKATKEQRTNTYDTLESLQRKGIVSFVIKNNKRIYIPNKPDHLLDFLKEKERNLIDILPTLQTLFKPKTKRPIIEVYDGIEGMRTVFNQSTTDYLKNKKEIIAFGAQQEECRTLGPEFHKRLYAKRKQQKIKLRVVITEDVKPLPNPLTKIRVLPKGYKSPVATYIYGDRVSFWMFLQVPTVIVIENKELAESYRNHFEILWKLAKDCKN